MAFSAIESPIDTAALLEPDSAAPTAAAWASAVTWELSLAVTITSPPLVVIVAAVSICASTVTPVLFSVKTPAPVGGRGSQTRVHAHTWAGHSTWLRASTTADLSRLSRVSIAIVSAVTTPVSTIRGRRVRVTPAAQA